MTRPRCEVCGCPMRVAYDAHDGAPYPECRPCVLAVASAPVASRFHGRGDRYDWDGLSRYGGDRTLARSTWEPRRRQRHREHGGDVDVVAAGGERPDVGARRDNLCRRWSAEVFDQRRLRGPPHAANALTP